MSLEKTLDQIESQYFGDLEENREAVLPAIIQLHHDVSAKGAAAVDEFSTVISERLGGIYIPYLFWKELADFLEQPERRIQLYRLIDAFSTSAFEEEEQKKMKALLIAYFAIEKEFELDKVQSLIIEKSHPVVKEYFRKITEFVKNNKNSVAMYTEKFNMLKALEPDFELLKLPVTKLKEKLEIA